MKQKELKSIRISKGVSQKTLTEYLGLSDHRCYSRKELGRIRFTNKEIDKLAKYFNLNCEDAYRVFILDYIK